MTEPHISTTPEPTSKIEVRNMTLAYLAIALLEIGFRKDIKRLRRKNEMSDLATVRELVDSSQLLGLAYQKIIRKCFYCDFSLGADLSSEELQDAVYSDVICSLRSLVKSCESLKLGN
ncbi:hypothetical protein BCR34DRAFT_596587 [Clohesyomyces aquaticus]|uniref:DUF7580 domain-containing protein n=1 Tax=Clohesyomyces aquaticus TaxID=1231657 RepID=A0A1Y2A679_9PLEO|nr:hypothetical protein BCR34DRAFT_596587 [Clohesyomyces aquaticus]